MLPTTLKRFQPVLAIQVLLLPTTYSAIIHRDDSILLIATVSSFTCCVHRAEEPGTRYLPGPTLDTQGTPDPRARILYASFARILQDSSRTSCRASALSTSGDRSKTRAPLRPRGNAEERWTCDWAIAEQAVQRHRYSQIVARGRIPHAPGTISKAQGSGTSFVYVGELSLLQYTDTDGRTSSASRRLCFGPKQRDLMHRVPSNSHRTLAVAVPCLPSARRELGALRMVAPYLTSRAHVSINPPAGRPMRVSLGSPWMDSRSITSAGAVDIYDKSGSSA